MLLFQCLIKCQEEVCKQFKLSKEQVELSMGMSSDYDKAVSKTRMLEKEMQNM